MSITIKNNILAVFIVQFDVHKGNVIEWQYPNDVDLEGVEYQAICSGLHRVESDIIYFYRQDKYGISVFRNIATNSIEERGACMKAIGLLVKPTEHTDLCGEVWSHAPFLKEELIKHMDSSSEATIDPRRYDCLIEYYTRHQMKREFINKANNRTYSAPSISSSIDNSSVNYSLRKISIQNEERQENHNILFSMDSSFPDFVQQLGPNIFVLWKAALLRKRIVLLNMPPMEATCKYVYNIHQLGQIPVQFQNNNNIRPLFTIGVNDIPQLEEMNHQSYIVHLILYSNQKQIYMIY
ncbi:uncharacterized protein BX663DRAFT_330231 [Cokeromyces recurvatus]|uniref:uncharacterized protein n=1 Tax=Cokeromyces recurvatus TaxID=90255 RepID=UPI00221FA232|nr:uncharacterized protein BX663DRAFT_330231 [Cokeromyces recurvatus]KAI7904847.1 hypothetical protein BX663DRAFT_330231 [Cokeromyces recurvatus]